VFDIQKRVSRLNIVKQVGDGVLAALKRGDQAENGEKKRGGRNSVDGKLKKGK